MRISDKQRISVWDILEGHKNPAPLSWVWFGAVKLERKPLTYEESHRNLKYHTHSLAKPSSYYYEALPLPPEEVEPVPVVPVVVILFLFFMFFSFITFYVILILFFFIFKCEFVCSLLHRTHIDTNSTFLAEG